MHTICTHTNTENNNMQHIEEEREQNTDTETNNHAQNNAQPQHRYSTYDLHTYSLDFYHEYIAIKNSNTIEIYTISKENI